jgi:hypothetical protein
MTRVRDRFQNTALGEILAKQRKQNITMPSHRKIPNSRNKGGKGRTLALSSSDQNHCLTRTGLSNTASGSFGQGHLGPSTRQYPPEDPIATQSPRQIVGSHRLEEVLKLGGDYKRRRERHERMPEIFSINGDLKTKWAKLRPQIAAERKRLKQLQETTTEDFDSCPSTSNEARDSTGDEETAKLSTQHRNIIEKKSGNAKSLGEKTPYATSCMQCRRRRTGCEGGSKNSACTNCLQRNYKCTLSLPKKAANNPKHIKKPRSKNTIITHSRNPALRSPLLGQQSRRRVNQHTGKSGVDDVQTMSSAESSSAPACRPSDSAAVTFECQFGSTEAGVDERVQSMVAPPSFCERSGEDVLVGPVLSPLDVIECSGTLIGPPCHFKTFSGGYLETYCGIKLQEAKDFRKSSGYWLCPTCSYKDERISKSQAQRAPVIDRIPSENGKLRFNDKQIEEPLARFHNVALHYILMVKQNPSGTTMQLPFLDLPLIRNEHDASHRKLTEILRYILDVPGGVPLGAHVSSMGLQTVGPEHVLRGVVSKLFMEQVLRGDALFDDVMEWKETLNSSESAKAQRREAQMALTLQY